MDYLLRPVQADDKGLLFTRLSSREQELAWANVAGVEQVHPASVAALTVAVGCVAAVASWLPARRATKVDPVDALRAE